MLFNFRMPLFFFFSSRRRHTRYIGDWSSDVCSSDLLERETRRQGIAVFVRPELVVEVALDGVQSSTRYAGGVALRFARVKRYRPDKNAEEADTIDDLRALLRRRQPA